LKLQEKKIYNKEKKEVIFPNNGKHTYQTLSDPCNKHGLAKGGACRCDTGYDGGHCDKCAAGYVNKDPSKPLQCVLGNKTEEVCGTRTCGCMLNSSDCSPLGSCDDATGHILCNCNPNLHVIGSRCEKCEDGYTGYPHCTKKDECYPACVNGRCDSATKQCICEKNWNGSPHCDKCTPGWTGLQCKTYSGGDGDWKSVTDVIQVFAIIVGCLIGVGAIAWIAWFLWKRQKKRRRNYFSLGTQEPEDGTEMQPPTASTTALFDSDELFFDASEAPAPKTKKMRKKPSEKSQPDKAASEKGAFVPQTKQTTARKKPASSPPEFDPRSPTTTTTTTTASAEDDFDPRALEKDEKQEKKRKGGKSEAEVLLNL